MSFLQSFDSYHEQASALTGLDDFGPDDYCEGLRVLLADMDAHSVYNALGKQTFDQQITGLLVGRLVTQQGLKDNPAATDTAIRKPLFIVGMARTGTTVLQRVLASDPAVQTLPFWLANAPMPRPPRESWNTHPVYSQINDALQSSAFFNEGMQAIHPVTPALDDECRWLLDQTFFSSTLEISTFTPGYFSWYSQADGRYAYEYYQRALQLIANGDERRWLLKDPSHMKGIDALLAVFPDACIVQTHREPVDCMRSIGNLAWQVFKCVSDSRDEEAYGEKTLQVWADGLNKMERVRRRSNSAQFFDLHMHEIKADTLGCIERIYDYFNIPVSDAARSEWRKQIFTDPNQGHDKKHQPPAFGLTADKVNREIADYYQRYLQVCEQAQVMPVASNGRDQARQIYSGETL